VSVRRPSLLLAGVCLASASSAVAWADSSPVSFVACPIYRDTNNGRKSGCWLATDNATGQRFDIGQSRSKPQLGHEVLVEGLSAGGDPVCGAPVLLPVHVSVLETLCPSFMLPAEGLPGRRFAVSPAQVLPPTDTPRPAPAGPFINRDWAIEYSFQSDFLQYQYSEVILDEIARYVLASHPKQVHITGYAVTDDRVVSGHHLSEPKSLAQDRAQRVALALQRLGVPSASMQVDWNTHPKSAHIEDDLPEPSRRRVDIHVGY
jgi:outer membrane protein OmpA-like peptidoglycan-associated protein